MEKQNMNRRKFLASGLTAAASVTVGKSFASEVQSESASIKKNDENPFNARTYNAMPTRAFGKTGYKVGILSLEIGRASCRERV